MVPKEKSDFRGLDLLELSDIRCFVAAADAPSFRSASRHVALSPAAFTARIQRLENALGAALFIRTTRSVRLTDAGRRLLGHARKLLEDAAQVIAIVHEDAAPLPFELTVGTRYELGMSWLVPALTPLQEQHPERQIHLYMGDTPDLLSRLERGDIDAVVTSTRLTLSHVAYAALHEETYVFVGRSEQVRRPEDVEDLTLVDVSPDLPLFRYLLDALPDSRPWPFAKRSYMGGIGAIRARVVEGTGVAVLPEYFVREDLASGRLTRLLPEQSLRTDSFRLVWRANHPRHDALQALASELVAFPLC